LPQLAPVAIQEAHHVAASITSEVTGRPSPKPFQYRDRGIMATIGRSEAVAQFRPNLRLSGFLGWVAWLGLHLIELIGFRNRANVLVNWAWNYLTYDGGARLILESGR
jgi:NADH dehydrogenase